MRQGNDVGTQYRSGIYVYPPGAAQSGGGLEARLTARRWRCRRLGPITTEILDAPPFYFAEDYHQQYLAKNPMGYCGLGGTGVSCPVGVGVAAAADRRVIERGSGSYVKARAPDRQRRSQPCAGSS